MPGVKAGHDRTEKFTFKFTPEHRRLLDTLSLELRLPKTAILEQALDDFALKHARTTAPASSATA
jgi:predicted transcriptional regulator